MMIFKKYSEITKTVVVGIAALALALAIAVGLYRVIKNMADDSFGYYSLNKAITSYTRQPTSENWNTLAPLLEDTSLLSLPDDEMLLVTKELLPVMLADGRFADADALVFRLFDVLEIRTFKRKRHTDFHDIIGKHLVNYQVLPLHLLMEKAAWMDTHSNQNDTYQAIAPEVVKPNNRELVPFVSSLLNRMGCRYETNLWEIAFKIPAPQTETKTLPDIDPAPYQSRLVDDVASLTKGNLPPLTPECALRLAKF